jgi:CheY-like chemotaxis protein
MIIGNAQLVLNDLPRDNPLWEDVDEIRKAGQRGAVLTRQLLAFGRSDIPHPETVNLNKIVNDISKLLKRLIGENIELHTVLASDLWKVYIDPGQIERVIMNLVVNARDVMLGGGILTVETGNVNLSEGYFRSHGVEGFPGSYVMLAITDTGPGMDEDVMAKMFEPFFTTKERGTGTGLGLSVVYGIVKQSKGYIWPYSEPGVGTTMKVYLPGADGDTVSTTVVPAERISGEKGSNGEVVLVVEDEESVRKLAMKSLQREGYKVLVASNGEDALRMNEQTEGEIHLLITDVIMPGMEGGELAERMVTLRPGIKVIYMSGYPRKTLAHNGVVTSDTNFLQKPFTPELLYRKVREILKS